VATGVAIVAAACGTGGFVSGGDVAHGKQVFDTTGKCASCHTLAAAGAQGIIGPNLDNAFSADRDQGFKSSTIQQIVADQIRLPLQGTEVGNQGPVNPTGGTVMPANLVHGKDLTDVTAFVAQCAGNPNDPTCRGSGAAITATAGKDIFQQAGCVACHTLKAAGATGTVGPNLDQKKPPFSLVVDRVTNGKTGAAGTMPSFKSKLTAAQIQAVAKYVSSVAGK